MNYYDFRKKVLGKPIDIDGFPASQPYQCVDLANYYISWLGGKQVRCSISGYAKDFANGKATNGILDTFEDIGLNTELQAGDLIVWTNCPQCPYSHVAIYDYDKGQNDVWFLGQNQPKPFVTIAKISTYGIIGVFRPKAFINKEDESGDGYKPTDDQYLVTGSKVVSDTFQIEGLKQRNGAWLGYSKSVGGWYPLNDVDEVDSVDGANDQVVHVGSGVQFNKGLMKVTGVFANNIVTVDKLAYPINANCLIEVE